MFTESVDFKPPTFQQLVCKSPENQTIGSQHFCHEVALAQPSKSRPAGILSQDKAPAFGL